MGALLFCSVLVFFDGFNDDGVMFCDDNIITSSLDDREVDCIPANNTSQRNVASNCCHGEEYVQLRCLIFIVRLFLTDDNLSFLFPGASVIITTLFACTISCS
jgi:hypothetical protein